MNLASINARIDSESSNDIISKLADISLLDEYKQSSSTVSSIQKLEAILEKHIVVPEKKTVIKAIVDDYILELIPAGTKGVIRGNKFNQIIKEIITDMHLDPEQFEYCFESQCAGFETSEKPDWFIKSKSPEPGKEKVLIGMNQLDLWGGGAQINRGAKYILERTNTDNSRLLCVVCNKIEIKTEKSKVYKLFAKGFENETLCYPGNLANLIRKYFSI